MFKVQSFIIVVVAIFIIGVINFSQYQIICGTLVRSTCTDDNTTKWNRAFVEDSLKKWLVSLAKAKSISEREKPHRFLRKTVLEFDKKAANGKKVGEGVQYIANLDCIEKTHVGPTWRKASTFSHTLFHDGFLYGIEDKNGELTGSNYCG